MNREVEGAVGRERGWVGGRARQAQEKDHQPNYTRTTRMACGGTTCSRSDETLPSLM